MAQIDTSIYGQIKPLEIESPMEVEAKRMQFQQMRNQNKLADLMFAEKAREAELSGMRRNALMAATNRDTGELDSAAYMRGLSGAGDYEGLQTFRKDQSQQMKLMREAEKERIASAKAQLELIGQVAGAAKDQKSYSDGLQFLSSKGVDISTVPQQYDPSYVETARNQSLSGVQQLEQVWKQKGFDLDVAKFGYQQQNDAANRSVQIRGQNLTDARGRDANRLKEKEIGVTEKGIVGKKIQDVELKLQDDYRQESKGFSETATAMKKVLAAIGTADKNPGSALSAGTGFMKLLDPNSVVRETELGMALNASGWFDRATNVANTLQNGRVMTPTQQKNLKAAAETLYEEAKAAQREIDAAYEQRARAYGADPSRVIVDRGQRNTKPAANAGGMPDQSAIDAELKRRGLIK